MLVNDNSSDVSYSPDIDFVSIMETKYDWSVTSDDKPCRTVMTHTIKNV